VTAPPRVLLVAGAYYPEISAAGIQCRTVAAALAGQVDFSVLVTAVDRTLPTEETLDGVRVHRVPINVRSPASKAGATVRMVGRFMRAAPAIDVVHLHGFSQKNVPVTWLSRIFGRPIVLTLHTAGQDEPGPVQRRGRLAYAAFRSANLILPVSPLLQARCLDAGIPPARVRLTPNGIDTARFRPASDQERLDLRRRLGWPIDAPVVVFVGFFSRDKRPDLLFRAWKRIVAETTRRPALVYIGATGPSYFEIDRDLASRIRADAAAAGVADRVLFVDPTNAIEECLRAADVFVMTSAREAHPVALLEAMASGLPSIATRLEQATDVIIEDRVNGRFFPVDDEDALAAALGEVLRSGEAARAMGACARDTIVNRYDIRRTAAAWRTAYADVMDHLR
jgi:glycosyltransferase involved in cell wall biosynthesis